MSTNTPLLHAQGQPLDTSPEAFGELHDSVDLVGDPAALRARMAEDGYLFMRGFLEADRVLAARRQLLEHLAAAGGVDLSHDLMEGIATSIDARGKFDGHFTRRKLQQSPAWRSLCHTGRLRDFWHSFLGGPLLCFDYLWLRTQRPGGRGARPHCDIVYMGRGTKSLYTTWIPLGDVPRVEGALMVLESSHRQPELRERYGTLDVDTDPMERYVAGGSFCRTPAEARARLGGRWLTTEFRAGDLICFGMYTLHTSLDNRSPAGRLRLSSDSRYQLATEAVDERWIGLTPLAHDGALPHSATRRLQIEDSG